jgi:hypothetical protein
MDDMSEHFLKLLMPRKGRPRVDPIHRVRDRYSAVWLKLTTGESFGSIERTLSGRVFDHRDGGSGGFNQPQLVARAARGAGGLSRSIVNGACERIEGFRQIYRNPLWSVLSQRHGWGRLGSSLATSFDPTWIRAYGLGSGSLATRWREDWTLAYAEERLVRRAGRLSDLSALALLIECTKFSAHWGASELIEGYAADVFARLLGKGGRTSKPARTSQQVAFQAVAESLNAVIKQGAPTWLLLEQSTTPLPMIRERPRGPYSRHLA